jgi:hypothetical protein
MTDYTKDDFNVVDRAALDRAIELTLAEADRVQQVRNMLAERGWWEAASFCAYHQQMKALALRPWESPPVHVDENNPRERDYDAVRLLKRMFSNGVSQYDPTPIDSIAAARK